MARKKLLLANDDGIFAHGLRTLAMTLAEEHDVYVCAPDRERSATGHSMSLHKPLMVSPFKDIHLISGIIDGFVTSGTPADCVKIALGTIWKNIEFDAVVSGINHGPNLGIDVLYSGTVSAAMEAMLNDLPALACSLYSYSAKQESDFREAALWIRDYITKMPTLNADQRTFLNINLPPGPRANYRSVELTRLGNREYEENYEERVDPLGRKYFWLAGSPIESKEVAGTDGKALLENRVSITPVKFDMTNYQFLEELKNAKV